jgi:hypothetical protein
MVGWYYGQLFLRVVSCFFGSSKFILYYIFSPYTVSLLILWRDRGCAVGVHDRLNSGIGRRIAVGSRNGRPVGRSQCIAQNTQNRVSSTVMNVV